jgi:transposase-like protein
VARRPITPEFFAALVAAFKQHGAAFTQVGRSVKCDYRTARRAWLEGWPERGLAPIKQIIESEKLQQGTALPSAAVPSAPELSRAKREEMLSDGLLVVGMHQLGLWRRLHPAALKLADRVQAAADDIAHVAPAQALALLNGCSRFADRAQKISETALKVEALRAGKPTEVVGVQFVSDDMTTEQVLREGQALIANILAHQGGADGDGATAPPAPLDLGASDDPLGRSAASATTCSCGGELCRSGSNPDPRITLYACRRCASRYRSADGGLSIYEDLESAKGPSMPVAQA